MTRRIISDGCRHGPVAAARTQIEYKNFKECAVLTVHHLATSQSDRIVWLCEELGIDYKLVRYDRDPVTRLAPPAYRALHPIGTAPIIEDGEIVLGESGAIVDYIIQRYANGCLSVAADDPAFPAYLFWLHFANGSLMPAAMMGLVAGMVPGPSNPVTDSLRARLERAWAMVEARLGEVPYLAGNAFSAADIMTLFPLTTMRLFAPRDLADYPNIRAYLQTIGSRPAFKRAMAKADPGFVVPLI
jgi:glutathione S-transferase